MLKRFINLMSDWLILSVLVIRSTETCLVVKPEIEFVTDTCLTPLLFITFLTDFQKVIEAVK